VTIDKTEFVRHLKGTAIVWGEVIDALRGEYPGFNELPLHDNEGHPSRELIFEALVWLGENRHRWWTRTWFLRGAPFARQAQVEQEFDIWFTDKCHEERKFLPKWFVEKARYNEVRHR
jgi:hypothetical protein